MESYNMLENVYKVKTNCKTAEENWIQEIIEDTDIITCGPLEFEPQKQLEERRCQTLRSPDSQDGPWHRLKTVFLVTIIVLLILWLVVYIMLSKMGLI